MSRILIVKNSKSPISETFVNAQIENLVGDIYIVYGMYRKNSRPQFQNGKNPDNLLSRYFFRIKNIIKFKKKYEYYSQSLLAKYLIINKIDIVIAQFGVNGVAVKDVCDTLKIPLVVFFRGYDVGKKNIISDYLDEYKDLFVKSSRLISVSDSIKKILLSLGASPEKIDTIPSGVDCNKFLPGDILKSNPHFLHVGRLVEKKAPHLLIMSFYMATLIDPNIKLTIIGDGPLYGVCKDLINVYKLNDNVKMLGEKSHDFILQKMKECRALIQHSITSFDGDIEGTPNSIKEASASGLPIISTKHSGIPELVLDGLTGFLVEERDISTMAEKIVLLSKDIELASKLGIAGREHMKQYYSMDKTMNKINEIVKSLIE